MKQRRLEGRTTKGRCSISIATMSTPPEPTHVLITLKDLAKAAEQERQYKQYLGRAEEVFDKRFAANACPKASINDFQILGYLSEGSFGQVLEAKHVKEDKVYALKAMPKSSNSKDVAAMLREKKITYALQSAFIIKLHYAFKDAKYLYLVMESAPYGDLSQFIKTRAGETMTRIFAAQIVLAIEYMHACNIVHRDLKCKNILIGSDFYLRVADLGLAQKLIGGKCYRSVGTPHCMAPETFGNAGYGKAVDWWALGIIIYELIFGCHPFAPYEWARPEVGDAVREKPLVIPEGYPETFAYDLIRGLLEKDCNKRLGAHEEGAAEVKRHKWFSSLNPLNIINKVPIEPAVYPVRLTRKDNITFQPGSDDVDEMGPDLFEEF